MVSDNVPSNVGAPDDGVVLPAASKLITDSLFVAVPSDEVLKQCEFFGHKGDGHDASLSVEPPQIVVTIANVTTSLATFHVDQEFMDTVSQTSDARRASGDASDPVSTGADRILDMHMVLEVNKAWSVGELMKHIDILSIPPPMNIGMDSMINQLAARMMTQRWEDMEQLLIPNAPDVHRYSHYLRAIVMIWILAKSFWTRTQQSHLLVTFYGDGEWRRATLRCVSEKEVRIFDPEAFDGVEFIQFKHEYQPPPSKSSGVLQYQTSSASQDVGATTRIIRMVELPAYPLEHPKFEHKSVPKASGYTISLNK